MDSPLPKSTDQATQGSTESSVSLQVDSNGHDRADEIERLIEDCYKILNFLSEKTDKLMSLIPPEQCTETRPRPRKSVRFNDSVEIAEAADDVDRTWKRTKRTRKEWVCTWLY